MTINDNLENKLDIVKDDYVVGSYRDEYKVDSMFDALEMYARIPVSADRMRAAKYFVKMIDNVIRDHLNAKTDSTVVRPEIKQKPVYYGGI